MTAEDKMKNAQDLFNMAIKELHQFKKDPDKIRDVSEKAWEATTSVVEALIEKKTAARVSKGNYNQRKGIGLG